MYVKLYQDILTSTVWMQPDHVLRVWLTMLLLANSEGYVRISIPGLAKEAGVDVLKARDALATLEAPDEDSQSKENEGRRVIRLDEAEPVWFIVNYVKYRTLKNAEAKKGYMREYMRAYRARRKQPELTSKGDVSLIPHCKSQGEGEGEGDGKNPPPKRCSEPQADSELEDAVLRFQLKDGTDWGLSQKLVDELKEAYPGIDVVAEARKARLWLIANPVKRKTLRGMPKFLSSWIERANNRGTAAGQMAPDVALDFNATFDRVTAAGGTDGNK